MLSSLEIALKDEQSSLNSNMGSLFHGYIMEKIPPKYSTLIHKNSLKPFSQYIYYEPSENNFIWKINTLTDEAKRNIIDTILTDSSKEIYLKHKNKSFKITKKVLKDSCSYKELADKYYISSPCKRANKLIFKSPTSFRVNNTYLLSPRVANIITSLYNRWNMFTKDISLEDKNTLMYLIEHTKIISYNLKSTKFHLEGIKIDSFLGRVGLYTTGSKTIIRILNILLAFSNYAGIGIKTTLGMGGVVYE